MNDTDQDHQAGGVATEGDLPPASGPPPPATEKPKRTIIDVLLLATVSAALILITTITIKHYPTSADAGTILGIVVPAFATIGAAVFGVTIAYSAGQAKGQAQGEQAKTNAAADAKAQTANALLPRVQSALDSVSNLRQTIQSAGTSLPGRLSYAFGPIEGVGLQAGGGGRQQVADVVEIDPQALDAAHGELDALRGALETLRDM